MLVYHCCAQVQQLPCSRKVFTLFTILFDLLRKPYQLLCDSGLGEHLGNLLVQLSSRFGNISAAVWQFLPKRANLNTGFVRNQAKTILKGLMQLGPWVQRKFRELSGAGASAPSDVGGVGSMAGNQFSNYGPGTSAGSTPGGDYSAFYSSQSAGLVQRSSAAVGAGAGVGAAASGGGSAGDLWQARPWPEQKRAD